MQDASLFIQLAIHAICEPLIIGLIFYFLYYKPYHLAYGFTLSRRKCCLGALLTVMLYGSLNYINIFLEPIYALTTLEFMLGGVAIYKYLTGVSLEKCFFWFGLTLFFFMLFDLSVSLLLIPFIVWSDLLSNTALMKLSGFLIFIVLAFAFSKTLTRTGTKCLRRTYHEYLMMYPLAMFPFFISACLSMAKTTLKGTHTVLNISFGVTVILISAGMVIYQMIKLRKHLAEEDLNFAVSATKPIVEDYLAQRHDIKNLLAALAYNIEEKNAPLELAPVQNYPVLNAMLSAKTKAFQADGFHFNLHVESFTDTLSATDLFELNLSTILSILLDNAKEHLAQNPDLPKWVTLKLGGTGNWIQMCNPISETGVTALRSGTQKGWSSKTKSLQSGFGLSNAITLADQIGAALHYEVAAGEVVFEVQPL